MEFFTYIFENYQDNLLGMTFAYIGIISIVVMFLPKNNIFSKIFRECASIITSLFKK
jgi:hypothetical protein|tara:strand:+ start:1561 stop:1731 length:171 start_codon:yes stop_codon:yes gene_type:complete